MSGADSGAGRRGAAGSHVVPALVVAAVGCLAFVPTLAGGLLLDDAALIPHHQALDRPWDLLTIFQSRYWGDIHEADTLYRPLVIWSLAVDAGWSRLLGLALETPVLFHATNIALHASVAVLLYFLAGRLGLSRQGALVAGLVFAAHPIHTEAVASIVNRSELLSAAFGLVFVLVHLAGRSPLLAALCLLGALFGKESGAAWLPLAGWLDFMLGRRPVWARYASYALVIVVWFALRALAVGGTAQDIPPLDNPLVSASWMERVLTALSVQLRYLQLQALPVGLSADYSAYQLPIVRSLIDVRVIAFLVIGASFIAAAWQLRHRAPIVALALGGYAILMFITSNLAFPIGTIMGERLAYAPSLFSCLVVGWAFRETGPRLIYAGLAVLGVLLFLTLRQSLVWTTPERFYLAQLAAAPNSAKSHYGVAHSVYAPSGDLVLARDHYLRAIEIYPDYPDAWNNLGSVEKDLGNSRAAAAAYARAVELDPRHRQAHANLGVLMHVQGDLQGAREAYIRALELTPDDPQTLNNLAMIYMAQQEFQRAKPLLDRALQLAPDYGLARENLQRLQTERP